MSEAKKKEEKGLSTGYQAYVRKQSKTKEWWKDQALENAIQCTGKNDAERSVQGTKEINIQA